MYMFSLIPTDRTAETRRVGREKKYHNTVREAVPDTGQTHGSVIDAACVQSGRFGGSMAAAARSAGYLARLITFINTTNSKRGHNASSFGETGVACAVQPLCSPPGTTGPVHPPRCTRPLTEVHRGGGEGVAGDNY